MGYRKYDTWSPLPHSLRVHLLRTTRDEASLIIGFAQTIHWIGSFVFSPDRLRINMLQLFAAGPAYVLLGKFPLFAEVGPALKFFACLLVVTILPLIYVVGLCILMIATGMRDPREWGKQIVEVENAPMEHSSDLRIFREGEDLASGLRHTQVYNFPGVRKAVVDIIRDRLTRQMAIDRGKNFQAPRPNQVNPKERISETDRAESDTLSRQ